MQQYTLRGDLGCQALPRLPQQPAYPGRSRRPRTQTSRTFGYPLTELSRAGPAGVQTQHVPGDRGRVFAGRDLALRIRCHALEQSIRIWRLPAVGEHPLVQLGEHCGPVIGLAPEHDPVAPAERLGTLLGGAQAAVDADPERGNSRLSRCTTS